MKKIFLAILILLSLFGCSGKKRYKNYKTTDSKKPWSWGKLQTVYVFADDDLWKSLKGDIKKALERSFYTTEQEKYFEIKRAKFENLEEFYKYNNLIFAGTLEASGEVSEYMKSVMKKSLLDQVKKKSKGIFAMNNPWARDQIVAFILADNKKNLKQEFIEKKDKIFSIFKSKLYARIREKVYKRELYPASSFDNLPWEMDITKNYVLYKKDKGFTSFISRIITKADKYVSVYYEKIDKKNFGKDWVFKARGKIGEKYYDGDKIDLSSVMIIGKSKISEYPCIRMHGRWQNEKYFIGGAFQCYGIYDDASQTAFLIDNSVYFPDGKKLLSMIELEVISETFKIKQIKKDERN